MKIPDRIRVIPIVPQPAAAVETIPCIQKALANPIGTSRLAERARPTDRVAIIVDDITRETPVATILPLILETLAAAGIQCQRISIVIALGTHRPMTTTEIDAKLGVAVARAYRVINDPADRRDKMVCLGESERGVPAWVHRTVARADLRIGIGTIMPHLDAGFGGGAKIVLPGVCGEQTVDAFHCRMARVTVNPLGMAEAPLRLDLEQFVQAHVPLHFIVNVILDHHGIVCGCVAGDAVKAHRAGVGVARKVFGVPVDRRFSVVVAGAHPHAMDLWQCTKALAAGEMLTRSAGHLILVADCPEGTGPHPRFADYMGMDLDLLLQALDAGDVEDRCAAAEATAVCRMRRRIRIGMVSAGVEEKVIRRMGFDPYPSVEAAIDQVTDANGNAEVAFLPYGGITLPLLADEAKQSHELRE